jgi:copper homeostasis protein
MIQLEICAVGLSSVSTAVAAGAHRVELCENLEAGGLTPSHGMIQMVRDAVPNFPIHVLVRPRRGNYVYDSTYLKLMIKDIRNILSMGYEGIVIGALEPDGTLAVKQMHAMIDAAEGMSITFHRAIDVALDPMKTIEQLIAMGVDRLLTSGNMPTAWEGRKNIALFQKTFGQDIKIMAGSGVNSGIAQKLIEATAITEIHASAKTIVSQSTNYPTHPDLVTDDWVFQANGEEIKRLLLSINP